MKHKEFLTFVEKMFSEVLADRVSQEDFNAILLGVNMIIEEVTAGRISSVYDAIDLAEKIQKPPVVKCNHDCNNCIEVNILRKLSHDKDYIINTWRKVKS